MKTEKKYFNLVCLFIFLIFCYFFNSWFFANETELYACDYVEQNMFFVDYASSFFVSPIETLKELFSAVYHSNRSPFLCLFLIPFYPIFDNSRFSFVFLNEVIFMLPVFLISFYILWKYILNESSQKSFLVKLMFCSSIFLFPLFWTPILNGIPDICGLPFVLFAFILYFKNKLDSKTSIKVLFLMSLCLYFSFLMRRWYSVAIFAFFLSVFLENLILSVSSFAKKDDFLKKIAYTVLNLSVIAIFITVFAFIFQGGYVKSIVQSELQERVMYLVSYNQLHSLFIENIGFIGIIFLISGLLFFIKNSNVRFIFFNGFFYLYAFIVLMNNQFLWINHYLFFAACFIILFSLGCYSISSVIKNGIVKNIFLVLVILFNCYNFSSSFITEQPKHFDFLFSNIDRHPIKNQNYEKVLDLHKFLNDEYEKNNDIAIAQYGLNTSIGYYQFRGIDFSNDFVKKTFLSETIFDAEFNALEINADYVILLDPLGLFADEAYSRILIDTAKQFNTGVGIAKNYELVKEFSLDDDDDETRVKLFKIKEKLSKSQIEEYLTPFFEYYPELKNREDITALYE